MTEATLSATAFRTAWEHLDLGAMPIVLHVQDDPAPWSHLTELGLARGGELDPWLGAVFKLLAGPPRSADLRLGIGRSAVRALAASVDNTALAPGSPTARAVTVGGARAGTAGPVGGSGSANTATAWSAGSGTAGSVGGGGSANAASVGSARSLIAGSVSGSGSANAGSANAGSANAGSANAGSANAGSANTGSAGRAGSATAGSVGVSGSAIAGSGTAGSVGGAGSLIAGLVGGSGSANAGSAGSAEGGTAGSAVGSGSGVGRAAGGGGSLLAVLTRDVLTVCEVDGDLATALVGLLPRLPDGRVGAPDLRGQFGAAAIDRSGRRTRASDVVGFHGPTDPDVLRARVTALLDHLL